MFFFVGGLMPRSQNTAMLTRATQPETEYSHVKCVPYTEKFCTVRAGIRLPTNTQPARRAWADAMPLISTSHMTLSGFKKNQYINESLID